MTDYVTHNTQNLEIKYANPAEKEPIGAVSFEPYSQESFLAFAVSGALVQRPEMLPELEEIKKTCETEYTGYLLELANIHVEQRLNYALDEALKGNIQKAWKEFVEFADFSDEQKTAIADEQGIIDRSHLYVRFGAIERIVECMDFLEEVETFYSGGIIKNPFEFARQITSYEDILTDEQKAKVYHSCAGLFFNPDNAKA